MCAPPWLCNAAKAACHAMLLAGCEPNEISTYACQPSVLCVCVQGGPASQPAPPASRRHYAARFSFAGKALSPPPLTPSSPPPRLPSLSPPKPF